jgi:hypothetical protein
MQIMPLYISKLMAKYPEMTQICQLTREAAMPLIREILLKDGQTIMPEREARRLFDRVNGIQKTMYLDEPESPLPMKSLGPEWVEYLSTIPNLHVISPALATALDAHWATESA